MTPDECIRRAEAIKRERPDATDLVLIEAKKRKAAKAGERDRCHRIPASQFEAANLLVEDIGEYFASRREPRSREACYEFWIAAGRQALQMESGT